MQDRIRFAAPRSSIIRFLMRRHGASKRRLSRDANYQCLGGRHRDGTLPVAAVDSFAHTRCAISASD
jgi:hypothetical protein